MVLPIRMTSVVSGSRMVVHLLHFLIAIIHVKLVTATQTIEALSTAIPIVVLAFLELGHAPHVEVHDTPTARFISLEKSSTGNVFPAKTV